MGFYRGRGSSLHISWRSGNSCLRSTVVHQAPLPMGFSKQEYWSGLPFPSPGGLPNSGNEPMSPAGHNLKNKGHSIVLKPPCVSSMDINGRWSSINKSESVGKLTQLCPTLCDPRTIQSMEFSRPEYWSGYPFPSPGDLPNPGIEPRSPALEVDSAPAEPQGKPCVFAMCISLYSLHRREVREDRQ